MQQNVLSVCPDVTTIPCRQKKKNFGEKNWISHKHILHLNWLFPPSDSVCLPVSLSLSLSLRLSDSMVDSFFLIFFFPVFLWWFNCTFNCYIRLNRSSRVSKRRKKRLARVARCLHLNHPSQIGVSMGKHKILNG